jgi:hypothetical protein
MPRPRQKPSQAEVRCVAKKSFAKRAHLFWFNTVADSCTKTVALAPQSQIKMDQGEADTLARAAKRPSSRQSTARHSRPRASATGFGTAAMRPVCRNALRTACARSAQPCALRKVQPSINSWRSSTGRRRNRPRFIRGRQVGGTSRPARCTCSAERGCTDR